jgi:nonsense-mediated mRNA decay protein 3
VLGAEVQPKIGADNGRDTTSISEKRDGLDFFYSERNHAIKMVEFLAGVVPCR